MIKKLYACESGATAVEYALVAATVAIVIVVATAALGNSTSNTWNTVANAIEATN